MDPVHDPTFAQARDFFLQGLAHYEAGRFAQAEQQFAASLALVPGRVSTLLNLGATRLKLGRAEEAIALLDEALAREPGSADALGHRATALAELGRLGDALAGFDAALAIDPAQGMLWSHRGNVLRELRRFDAAAASFERALACGHDPELNRFYLSAVRGEAAPVMPSGYVQALFDSYAGGFDEHLRALGYDAPAALAQGLAGRHFTRGLDLGCGTGAAGPYLAPLCDALDGVDLSAAMVEKARATGRYATVTQADVVAFLRGATQRWDLAVAADVLIYLGDPQPVFESVARVLEPGGHFCFTAERADEARDFVLQPSLRYAHSERALRELAQRSGFTDVRIGQRTIRQEQRAAIPGLFAWMRRG